MKNILLPILILFIVCFLPQKTKASHVQGGEITWECTPQGGYIFKMVVYTDCASSVQFPYIPYTLEVFANPLPRGQNGQLISSIYLRPDSAKWLRKNNGELKLDCRFPSPNPSFSCARGDVLYRAFYYQSDTIQFTGPVSPNGMRLVWTAPCCRLNSIDNLALGGTSLLRARIYPDLQSNNLCLDDSPKFVAEPTYYHCRNFLSTSNYMATDLDGDSLVYSFSSTYNSPAFNPILVPYSLGFTFNNPTPDQSFDTNNLPSVLNPRTGLHSFRVSNSQGWGRARYHVVVEVKSYKNARQTGSIYRDLPIIVTDCPILANGAINQAPQINSPFFRNGNPSFKDSVVVGNPISAPIIVSDTNLFNQGGQEITIRISGDNLSNNYSMNGTCPIPGDSSCAYIWSFNTPLYDSTDQVYQFQLSRFFNGNLRWTPDCSDLDPNGNAKTYYFPIKVKDDHCPIPAIRHEVIEITVLPDPMNPCGSVTSLEENESLQSVSIFPNPTSGLVQLKLPAEPLQLRILNIQGQLIKEQQLTANTEINLTGPSGIYFLEFTNQQGERVFKKVVKK